MTIYWIILTSSLSDAAAVGPGMGAAVTRSIGLAFQRRGQWWSSPCPTVEAVRVLGKIVQSDTKLLGLASQSQSPLTIGTIIQGRTMTQAAAISRAQPICPPNSLKVTESFGLLVSGYQNPREVCSPSTVSPYESHTQGTLPIQAFRTGL